MKVSSLSAGNMMQVAATNSAPDPVLAQLRVAISTLLAQLDRVGTAIALGEAGDLDGAHALRDQNSGSKNRQ